MKDSPNLDLLRAFAVALVVLSHMPDVLGWNWNTWSMGRVGVGLFFVHTTLVLMQSLDRTGPAAMPFYVRRVFRVYPLSIATVLLLTGIMWLGNKPLSVAEFTSNVLLLQQAAGHWSYPPQLWTLPYELEMYLLLPAIYAFTRAGSPLAKVAALYAVGLLPGLVLWGLSIEKVYSLSFIPCFLPGVIAFVLARRVRATFSPLLLAGIVLGCSIAIPPLVRAGANEMALLWVMCLLVGIAIPFCRDVTFAPLAAAGRLIATYSYGIYLTHLVVIGLTLAVPGPWWVRWPAFLFFQLAIAAVAYRWIEAPGIALGKRLALRSHPAPAAVALERASASPM
jgi:peptidoglycan/LPS O-acetylase OafA/YrhL